MSKRKEHKHTISDLYQMQSLPLEIKIRMTRRRIREWVDWFGVDGIYVSFSGGKDSTVLLDIVRKDYPNVEAVFVNTGLEYPSVRKFALSKENVTELRPDMNFRDVVIKYGYPIISKEIAGKVDEARKKKDGYAAKVFSGSRSGTRWDISNYSYLLDAPFKIHSYCCDAMKKNPCKKYEKETGNKAIIATMADESKVRTTQWLIHGCNAFDKKRQVSNPMSFWIENDILTYIHENNLEIADAYGDVVVDTKGQVEGQLTIQDLLGDYRDCKFYTTGCKRTGCIFCGFGITQDKDRFIRLSEKEPALCDYVMRGGTFDTDGMWKPTNDGLGYWFVLEWLNLHGIGIGMPNRNHYLCKYSTQQTSEFLDN